MFRCSPKTSCSSRAVVTATCVIEAPPEPDVSKSARALSLPRLHGLRSALPEWTDLAGRRWTSRARQHSSVCAVSR